MQRRCCRTLSSQPPEPQRKSETGSRGFKVITFTSPVCFFSEKGTWFLSHVAGDIKTLLLSLAVSHHKHHPWSHTQLYSIIKLHVLDWFPVLIHVCFVDLRGLAAVPRGMTTTNKGNKALKVSGLSLPLISHVPVVHDQSVIVYSLILNVYAALVNTIKVDDEFVWKTP